MSLHLYRKTVFRQADQWPLTKSTSSFRCKMLRDTVLRRSGCLPCTEPRGDPPSGLKAPRPPSHHPPAQADYLQLVTTGIQTGCTLPDHGSPQPSPPRPRPIFSLTTLITGDSIIRIFVSSMLFLFLLLIDLIIWLQFTMVFPLQLNPLFQLLVPF